eukprot:6481536-Amphidinium_carterae.1
MLDSRTSCSCPNRFCFWPACRLGRSPAASVGRKKLPRHPMNVCGRFVRSAGGDQHKTRTFDLHRNGYAHRRGYDMNTEAAVPSCARTKTGVNTAAVVFESRRRRMEPCVVDLRASRAGFTEARVKDAGFERPWLDRLSLRLSAALYVIARVIPLCVRSNISVQMQVDKVNRHRSISDDRSDTKLALKNRACYARGRI